MLRLRLSVLAAVATVALVAAGGARATSNSLALAISPAHPTDAGGFTITASGSTASNSDTFELFVHYQPGSGACAADPDGNPPLDPDSTLVGPGAFSVQSSTPQNLLPGTYTLCGWVQDLNTGPSTVATASAPLTVTAADTMSMTFSAPPEQGRSFDLSAVGQSYDNDAVVDATYKPVGGKCAATLGQDTGTSVDPGENPSATGTGSYNTLMGSGLMLPPGSYLFCAWLFDQATGTVLKTSQSVVTVSPLHATMQLHVPTSVAQGGGYVIKLDVTVDYGIPVTAWVDVVSKGTKGCARSPTGEPGSAENPIDDDLEATHQPNQTFTSTSDTVPVSNGSQLVCAWLLDNWSGSYPQPVVSGPISATVSVAQRLVFKGHTSQKRPIKIYAAPFASEIFTVRYSARFHCNGTPRLLGGNRWNGIGNDLLSYVVFGVARPDSAGRFKIKEKSGSNHVIVLHGRVQGRVIKGTFTDRAKSWVFTHNPGQSLSCHTGLVHFTATAP